jgi:hypothetical protein
MMIALLAGLTLTLALLLNKKLERREVPLLARSRRPIARRPRAD